MNSKLCVAASLAVAVCLGGVAPLDEMEAEWIAKDGPIPANVTHADWRAEKLARRAERLKPVVAMARKWVYCRHYVLGGWSTFLHLSELSDAFEARSYRAIGSSICLAEHSPEGLWKETVLAESKEGCFRDVDVSPDGTHIVYSFKASDRGDDFHLYCMDLVTRNVTQLTFGLGAADIEPCYLPDGRILFNSTRCAQVVDCWWNEVFNLYRCDADGSNLTRVTYDQVNDYFPTLADDGRVFYMRWEYNDRGQIYTQPVFSMNPNGTYQRAVYGGNSYFPNCILQARSVPGSPLFFAIGTGHHSWQPGELMRFDPREGREETAGCWQVAPLRRAQFVKRDSNFGQQGDIYCYPYPVNEESVVISHLRRKCRNAAADHEFGLCWTDVHGARELLVAQQGKVACGRPVPVRARRLPARSSEVPAGKSGTGAVTIADVYAGEAMKGVRRGEVKALRVVALDYRPAAIGRTVVRGPGGFAMNGSPPGLGNSTWIVKKVLGEVPVEEDGSVAVTLPARTPFYFQLLDAKGRMVQTMRSWTMLQPGEVASCVGCHESANDAPDYRLERHPVPRAALAPVERGFSFCREVQPILDRRCASCHNPAVNPKLPDLTATAVRDPQAKRMWTKGYLSLTHARYLSKTEAGLHGTGGSQWWENLWLGDPAHPDVNWVDVGSTASLLPPMWRGSRESALFYARLDKGHAPDLTPGELRTLATWGDLGVPFCGSYDERVVWSEQDWDLWNRGIMRRARFETDGHGAQQVLATADSQPPPHRPVVTNLVPKDDLVLGGVKDHPAVFNLEEGVVDLETNGGMLQCGLKGSLKEHHTDGGYAVFNQSGGEVRCRNWAVVGRYAGDVGWYNMTGGFFRQANPKCMFYVGEEGEGHLLVEGGAFLSSLHVRLGRAPTCRNSTVTLGKGGRIRTGSISALNSVNPIVIFDGGTIETYNMAARYGALIASNVAVRVKAGGTRFDVGLDTFAAVPAAIVADAASAGGGLVKAGYGVLELGGANTYTGVTRIEAGELRVRTVAAVERSALVEVRTAAAFGVAGEALAAASKVLAGKVRWGLGSVLVVDASRGRVELDGDQFLGAQTIEKIGQGDLVIRSPLKGVGEIRARQGRVCISPASAASVKLSRLGGEFALNGVSGLEQQNPGRAPAARSQP